MHFRQQELAERFGEAQEVVWELVPELVELSFDSPLYSVAEFVLNVFRNSIVRRQEWLTIEDICSQIWWMVWDDLVPDNVKRIQQLKVHKVVRAAAIGNLKEFIEYDYPEILLMVLEPINVHVKPVLSTASEGKSKASVLPRFDREATTFLERLRTG